MLRISTRIAERMRLQNGRGARIRDAESTSSGLQRREQDARVLLYDAQQRVISSRTCR